MKKNTKAITFAKPILDNIILKYDESPVNDLQDRINMKLSLEDYYEQEYR